MFEQQERDDEEFIKYLMEEIDELENYSEKLRSEISHKEFENEKLRELVRDMCNLLPHADWPSIECDEKASACIEQAIKLGIEEDE